MAHFFFVRRALMKSKSNGVPATWHWYSHFPWCPAAKNVPHQDRSIVSYHSKDRFACAVWSLVASLAGP